MSDTAQKFLTSLEDLFLNFNFRRLLYWLFIISFMVLVLVYGERMTNYLYFWRIEKRILLLKELQALDQSGIANNGQLSSIYNDLVAELATYKVYNPSFTLRFGSNQIWKFVTGTSVGLIMIIIGFAINIHDGNMPPKKPVIGMAIWAIVFGIIGLVLPTIYSPWVNYLSLPLLQVLILLVFFYTYDSVSGGAL